MKVDMGAHALVRLFQQTTLLRHSALLGCALALALLLPAASAQAQQQIGYVLELNGNWMVGSNPSRAVAKGQALAAGSVLRIQNPTPYDYITIASLNGDQIIARKHCNNTSDCQSPWRLEQTERPRQSATRIIIGKVMELIWGEPERYSVHRVRGAELPDSLLELKDGRLDLKPLFSKKEKDQYYLRLTPIPLKESSLSAKALPVKSVNWEPSKQALIAAEGIRPGLYEAALMEKEGDGYKMSGTPAWVLVSDARQYESANSSFQEAAAMADGWGEQVTDDTKRSFLRAHLDYLARQSKK